MFTLRSLHALAARLLPPAFGALEEAPLGELARFPACFGWLGVEARLDDAAALDLAVSLEGSPGARRALVRALPALEGATAPNWRPTLERLGAWADGVDDPRPSAIWLEVDRGREASPPIVFLTTLGLSGAEVVALLDGLAPGRAGPARRLVAWWVGRGAVHHLADLAPRGLDAVRIVGSLAAADLEGLLARLGWGPDRRALQGLARALGELADPWTLDVDLGEAARPRLGVECHLPTDPAHDRRWRSILAHAAACGASPAKLRALDGWPKRHVLGDMITIHRHLHLKFTFTGDAGPSAKAYLGVRPEAPARAPRGRRAEAMDRAASPGRP
ncbi:MAG: hypothetical protein R3B09_14645 [Nannocystaceae bacterium]